jgi:putative flippase GtrA
VTTRLPPDLVYDLSPPLLFLLVLACVSTVALLIQWAIRIPAIARAAPQLMHVTPAVSTIAGAIFGLSMSFLANSVWNTEDGAHNAVNSEARAIRVMALYIDSLTAPAYEGMSKLVADYGKAVAAEWTSMNEDDYGTPAEIALRTIYGAVIGGLAEGDQNRLLQQRLLISLDELSAARQERLSIAENFVSISQWTLVVGLGIVLLFVVTLNHIATPLARRVAVAAVAMSMSIMLYVILLHDRPFIGYDAISPDPILKATGAAP